MSIASFYEKKIQDGYLEDSRKEVFVKFLCEVCNRDFEDMIHLSFKDIANLIDKNSYDDEFFELINTLESPSIGVLIRKHEFIEDGYVEEIEPSDLDDMVENGFVHPITGELVEDWKNHIFPFFTLSDKFKEDIK